MVIAVTNLKGGVGKTTIATNLAVTFAHAGKSVCIVDSDMEQQSSGDWEDARPDTLPYIAVNGRNAKQLNRYVAELRSQYDYIIIDGSPQLSELADRTILASDQILIPLTPSIYDYRGFESFLERFEQMRDTKIASGGSVKAFVVLNRVIQGTKVSGEIREAVKAYDIEILDSYLVNRVAYSDSASEGKGVIEYKDRKAAKEMQKLADELIQKMQ